jgi:hypothetical protein
MSASVLSHIQNLIACRFEIICLTGNDGKSSVKCIFHARDQAVALIDHLFQAPFNIGSTTNGKTIKKTPQHIEGDKWAVFIREDQLHDYYAKALAPVQQPNLAMFVEAFSIKQHIYQVMAEAYPDKHVTSANIKIEVVNGVDGEELKISIKQQQFAEDFLKYLQKYISIPNVSLTKENNLLHSFTLTAISFFRYISLVPVNHSYLHHTFETLVEKSIAKLTEADRIKQSCVQNALINELLGKYCYLHDAQQFNRQQISMKMISDYLVKTLRFAAVSMTEVESILQDKVENLIAAESLLFKMVRRHENARNEFFYFQLERMSNPGMQRTTRGLNLWFFPEAKHIERNRHRKYNPQTQEWHDNHKQDERGRAKPARLHTKRTSMSLSPADIGAAGRPWKGGHVSSVYLLFDLKECEIHHKYIFNHDVGSDFEWWYEMPNNREDIPAEWYKYFGANHAAFDALWKPRSTNINGLRAHNRALHEEWKSSGETAMWSEILTGLPEKLIRGIGARDNTLYGRLNALAAAYEVKLKFSLDYSLPIFIIPIGQKLMKYAYEQRMLDVIQALREKDASHPSETILKAILAELCIHADARNVSLEATEMAKSLLGEQHETYRP